METSAKVMGLLMLLLALVIFFVFLVPKGAENIGRFDECVSVANEAGLDPNDDQRAEFIKDCYEKND